MRSAAPDICVVGAGAWGLNHVETLRQLGRLGAIVESDPQRRDEARATYAQTAVLASVDEALARGYTAFVVATPSRTHYEVARALLDRGAHVLVEKPLALVAEEARDLCRRAEDRKIDV